MKPPAYGSSLSLESKDAKALSSISESSSAGSSTKSNRVNASQAFLSANGKRKREESPGRKSSGSLGMAPRRIAVDVGGEDERPSDIFHSYQEAKPAKHEEHSHDVDATSNTKRPLEEYTDSATYEASTFGGLGVYLQHKRQKL